MNGTLILIAATKNKHKTAEFRDIFTSVSGGKIEVLSEEAAIERYFAGAREYTAPEETGNTFAANAFIKAAGLYAFLCEPLRAAAKTAPVLIAADDSGLCVDALHGAPGVLSARYASRNGENASDRDNVEKLLSELKEVPDEKRNASFVCAISAILLRNEENPVELYAAEGSLPGVIARAPRGTNGFGYDPVLYLPEYGKCVAELEPGLKNAVSHRGKALRQLAYRYYGIY